MHHHLAWTVESGPLRHPPLVARNSRLARESQVRRALTQIQNFIGPGTTRVGLRDAVIAGMTALVGIWAAYALTIRIAGPWAEILMVGSMGAATVWLFAVSHGALVQLCPVFGGQVVSPRRSGSVPPPRFPIRPCPPGSAAAQSNSCSCCAVSIRPVGRPP
ncbi:MAG: HPP family protein [Pseudomonadota bacterium]